MPSRSLSSALFSTPLSLSTLLPLSLHVLAVSALNVQKERRQTAAASTKNVILQLFEWNWDSLAAECTNFIGPAGYGYVQVSPPQEHVSGTNWWTDYQPVSYQIASKRGNREQFVKMVDACHAAGVKVIADAVLNHMAGTDSGVGTAGTAFTHYNYPGVYSIQDFHHCGLTAGDDIVNYNDRNQVQNCELVNLADLATGSDYVRGKTSDYLKDLKSMGVDGFRMDGAKHMAAGDVGNILSRAGAVDYITQEVIFGAGEPIQPSEYVGNGNVQEFRFTYLMKSAFLNGNIAQLQNLDGLGWIAGTDANVFVANHDTERGGDSLRYDSPSNTFTLATIYSLAFPYGTPTVLSSYSFSDKDAGSPNNGAGACNGSGGSGGWLCQHRWNAIAGMVGFHNTVGGNPVSNWQQGSSSQIAFGRGSAGFVVINNGDGTWSNTFRTSLPDGAYCDVYAGLKTASGCAGNTVTVSGGQFQGSVNARSALAIHTGALAGAAPPASSTPAPVPSSVPSASSAPATSLSLPPIGSSLPTTSISIPGPIIVSVPAAGGLNTAGFTFTGPISGPVPIGNSGPTQATGAPTSSAPAATTTLSAAPSSSVPAPAPTTTVASSAPAPAGNHPGFTFTGPMSGPVPIGDSSPTQAAPAAPSTAVTTSAASSSSISASSPAPTSTVAPSAPAPAGNHPGFTYTGPISGSVPLGGDSVATGAPPAGSSSAPAPTLTESPSATSESSSVETSSAYSYSYSTASSSTEAIPATTDESAPSSASAPVPTYPSPSNAGSPPAPAPVPSESSTAPAHPVPSESVSVSGTGPILVPLPTPTDSSATPLPPAPAPSYSTPNEGPLPVPISAPAPSESSAAPSPPSPLSPSSVPTTIESVPVPAITYSPPPPASSSSPEEGEVADTGDSGESGSSEGSGGYGGSGDGGYGGSGNGGSAPSAPAPVPLPTETISLPATQGAEASPPVVAPAPAPTYDSGSGSGSGSSSGSNPGSGSSSGGSGSGSGPGSSSGAGNQPAPNPVTIVMTVTVTAPSTPTQHNPHWPHRDPEHHHHHHHHHGNGNDTSEGEGECSSNNNHARAAIPELIGHSS